MHSAAVNFSLIGELLVLPNSGWCSSSSSLLSVSGAGSMGGAWLCTYLPARTRAYYVNERFSGGPRSEEPEVLTRHCTTSSVCAGFMAANNGEGVAGYVPRNLRYLWGIALHPFVCAGFLIANNGERRGHLFSSLFNTSLSAYSCSSWHFAGKFTFVRGSGLLY